MVSKYIVFASKNHAELAEREILPPGPEEVQVRLAVSSISSGTERANLSGELNVSIGTYYKEAQFPRYSGYSSAGVVEAVGERVTKVKPGDRVALIWSTHSQVLNIRQSCVFPIGDDISFEEAALLHIACFPLAALRKCRLEIGESVVVMGMGILGILSLPLLRAAGAVPIVAVDPKAEKREKALKSGADHALDPYAPDFAQETRALTGGGARTAIEVTGVGKGLDGALDCMAPRGRVALLGCTRHSDFTIDYYHKVHGPGITLIGAHTDARPREESYGGYWTAQDDMNALIRLSRSGRIRLAALVDETHSPLEAPEIYTRLVSEPSFPLVQFDWRRL